MARRLRAFLILAGLCLLSGFVGSTAAAVLADRTPGPVFGHAAPWGWFLGGPQHAVYVGRLDGSSDLTMATTRMTDPSDWQGRQITFNGADGNFEFEHFAHAHKSVFTAVGKSGKALAATPIVVGAVDGQDVVPLIAAADASKSAAVQTWTSGSRVVAAVRSDGGLVLGGIELVAAVDAQGRVEVDAILKSGARQTLLVGVPN